MKSYDYKPFRSQIERQLGSALAGAEWRFVLAERYPEKYYQAVLSVDEICNEIRKLRRFHAADVNNSTPPKFVTPRPKQRGDIPSPTRQLAISYLLANSAHQEPEVQAFRQEVLGGTLISETEVANWIEEQSNNDGRFTVWIKAPLPEGYHLKFDQGTPQLNQPFTLRTLAGCSLHSDILEYTSPGQAWVRGAAVRYGGVLFRLHQLCEMLSSRYRWQPDQAATFVLTGAIPLISAMDVKFLSANRVQLTIDPALSPREVANTYKQLRFQMIGRRYRPLSEKHIQLALFSASHRERKAKQQWSTWNKKYPRWKYSALSNFMRDCEVAKRRLLGVRDAASGLKLLKGSQGPETGDSRGSS